MTRIFGYGLLILLISCAPTRDPFGLALLKGRTPSPAAPESLRVDVGIALSQKGALPFSARLYAEPYRRYRLDAFGFPSRIAASYLWIEGRWTLQLYAKREIFQGRGDSVSLDVDGLSLHLPDVHALLGPLWGDPLPGFRNRDSGTLARSGDTLRWSSRGINWLARFDSLTGLCLETHSSTLKFRYSHHQRQGARIVPRDIEVFLNGESVMELQVNQIDEHPVWKKDPFTLPGSGKWGLSDGGFPKEDGESSKNESGR
jgi:hypothetical protein